MLKKLNIKNFKCFFDQDIQLNNLSVFAGSNGVGKSTVIQSLLLMRQTINMLSNSGIACNIRILLNGPFLLSLGNANEIINSDSSSNIIEFAISDSSQNILKLNYEAKETDLIIRLQTDPFPSLPQNLSLSAEEFHYLNAERIGPRNIQEVVDQDFINTGYRGEYTGQAIAKAETLNKTLGREDKRIRDNDGKDTFFSLLKQIEAWMDFIIPHIKIKIESFPQIYSVRVSLKNDSSKTDFLHPSNIGFGITYALPIVVSGLLAKEGCVLIVENPEAHLHPSGQSKIGQFLAQIASAGIQIIIETHSEHIINGIRIAILNGKIPPQDVIINFFSLKDKNSTPNVDSITLNDKGDLSDWPKGFFDQEEQDLANIFKLKRK